jgi:hypothetical protein
MLCRGSSPFLPSPTARRQSNLPDTLLHLEGVLCLLVAWAAVISISRVEIPLVCGTWVEPWTWGQLVMLLSPRHEPCFCWLGAKDTSYATVVHAHIISIPHVDWPQLELITTRPVRQLWTLDPASRYCYQASATPRNRRDGLSPGGLLLILGSGIKEASLKEAWY